MQLCSLRISQYFPVISYDCSINVWCSCRAAQKSLISEDILWISQSHNLTSTGVIQHSEMSLSSEHKLELETHHSSTIFCDMMSPDEWKSSLPMVLQQNDASGVPSPTSPSNSIENLVLELENSNQDIDMGSPFTQCSGKFYFRHYKTHLFLKFFVLYCVF